MCVLFPEVDSRAHARYSSPFDERRGAAQVSRRQDLATKGPDYKLEARPDNGFLLSFNSFGRFLRAACEHAHGLEGKALPEKGAAGARSVWPIGLEQLWADPRLPTANDYVIQLGF
jgi:hypothetical protein